MNSQLLVNLSFLLKEPTGISTYALGILPYLHRLSPRLLTPYPVPRFSCQFVPTDMTPAHGSKGHLRRLLWTQFQLPSIYRQHHTRLLFSPLPEAPLYSRCQVVVMAHDLIPLRFPRRFSRLTAFFRYYIPQVLTQATHILCNSIATANDLMHFFQVPSQKLTVTPLAYDAERFQNLHLARANYFLYLGRHDEYKNLQRVIAAFAQVPNYRNYELWLAGPSDQRMTPRLHELIETLGLQPSVKFLDYVPAETLPMILNQAIALVFPSLWEGFGLPVVEAMACGTPVITSNCSSLPEVAGDAALLINPYETDEITDAMHQVATDRATWQDLHTASLARAAEFSWQKTGEATADVLSRFC
jgi:glycosyltransferase involved in cell wall biosynthesis